LESDLPSPSLLGERCQPVTIAVSVNPVLNDWLVDHKWLVELRILVEVIDSLLALLLGEAALLVPLLNDDPLEQVVIPVLPASFHSDGFDQIASLLLLLAVLVRLLLDDGLEVRRSWL